MEHVDKKIINKFVKENTTFPERTIVKISEAKRYPSDIDPQMYNVEIIQNPFTVFNIFFLKNKNSKKNNNTLFFVNIVITHELFRKVI